MSTNQVCVFKEDGETLLVIKSYTSVKAAYAAIAAAELGEGPFTVATIWAAGVTLKPKPQEFDVNFGARYGGGRGRSKAPKAPADKAKE